MASILVIEPDEPVLRLIGWALIEAGHEVATTLELEDAVTLAERHRPDLIIFNGPMRTSTLEEHVSRIRELVPQAKVIDLHEAGGAYDEQRMFLADAAIEKPFPAIDLLDTIDLLLAEDPLLSDKPPAD
jgi:DNA-binding response OmpR family regulator